MTGRAKGGGCWVAKEPDLGGGYTRGGRCENSQALYSDLCLVSCVLYLGAAGGEDGDGVDEDVNGHGDDDNDDKSLLGSHTDRLRQSHLEHRRVDFRIHT